MCMKVQAQRLFGMKGGGHRGKPMHGGTDITLVQDEGGWSMRLAYA